MGSKLKCFTLIVGQHQSSLRCIALQPRDSRSAPGHRGLRCRQAQQGRVHTDYASVAGADTDGQTQKHNQEVVQPGRHQRSSLTGQYNHSVRIESV